MNNETKNVKKVLYAYVTDPKTWFYWYHSPVRLKALYSSDDGHKKDDYGKDEEEFTKNVWRFESKTIKSDKGERVIEKNLADFFDAVLDEVRLKKANDFAEYALYISDNDDLAYFRNTVAKREITADIDYDRQRDHAVHTVYNYLLGWYIFEYSGTLRGAFEKHLIKKLKIDLDKQKKYLQDFYRSDGSGKMKFDNIEVPEPTDLDLIGLVHEFADVWPIASLFHDIGYILEGSLSSASPNVEHDRVKNGSKIIHDYFNHYFWKSYEVDFRVAKNIAKTLGVVVPDFRYSESIASIGDRLCDIGSCENIRNNLDKNPEYKLLNGVLYEPIQQKHGLNREAFSIWKEHYKRHGNKKMEDILYIVERVYKDMMWVGADHGKRNLDHGVCSGLISLQALTFFYELFWGFCLTKWSPEPEINLTADSFSQKQEKPPEDAYNRVSEELFGHIDKEITRVPKRIMVRGEFDSNICTNHDKNHCKLRSDFWFKKVLWATASSAIHSIIQKDEYSKQCKKHLDIPAMKLKEQKERKNPDDHKDHLRICIDDDPPLRDTESSSPQKR